MASTSRLGLAQHQTRLLSIRQLPHARPRRSVSVAASSAHWHMAADVLRSGAMIYWFAVQMPVPTLHSSACELSYEHVCARECGLDVMHCALAQLADCCNLLVANERQCWSANAVPRGRARGGAGADTDCAADGSSSKLCGDRHYQTATRGGSSWAACLVDWWCCTCGCCSIA